MVSLTTYNTDSVKQPVILLRFSWVDATTWLGRLPGGGSRLLGTGVIFISIVVVLKHSACTILVTLTPDLYAIFRSVSKPMENEIKCYSW